MQNKGAPVWIFDGAKSSLQELPALLDSAFKGEGTSSASTPGASYGSVSYVYRCVQLRAQALSRIPFRIRERNGGSEVDWPLAHLLPRLLWLTEASLCLFGAAYWFRERNRVRTLNYRWLATQTVEPKYSRVVGLLGFTRTLDGHPTMSDEDRPWHERIGWRRSSRLRPEPNLTIDDVVYFFLPDPEVEVGPGRAPAEVALEAIGLAKHLNEFATAFFKRGAIPAVLLAVEGNPPDAEMKKLEAWWKRLLMGVKKAWQTVAVRASVKPVVIGQPVKDLAMPALSESARRQIAVAMGVPVTLLEDAANFACLPGDQHVYTPIGPTPIAQLKPGDPIWQWSEYGWKENLVEEIIAQGPAPVFEITTPRRRLRASENHPILTVCVRPGRGPYDPQTHELKWKRADELDVDDLIIVAEEFPDQGAVMVEGLELTESFMELCGLYTGDGCTRGGAELQFAIPEGPLQDYYASEAERLFAYSDTTARGGQGTGRDYNTGREFRCRRRHYHFTIGSRDAARLFARLGLTGDSRTKRAPCWVFRLALNLRLAYLRGYVDSDGSVSARGSIVFGSANLELMHDIRALCISCGIPVSNIQHDIGRIGNFGPIECYRFTCGYPKYNRLIGSHDPRYVARLKIESRGRRDGRWVPGAHHVKHLQLPAGSSIDRIVSIDEVGEQDVFDLVTTGTHTFVAEGVVVHNTAKEHRKSFYQETVIPEAELIAGVLNEQIFYREKLEFAFLPEHLEIMQEEEAERAGALQALVQSGMPLLLAMRVLGYDVDEDVLDDYELELTLQRGRAQTEAERLALEKQKLRLNQARERLAEARQRVAEQREQRLAQQLRLTAGRVESDAGTHGLACRGDAVMRQRARERLTRPMEPSEGRLRIGELKIA